VFLVLLIAVPIIEIAVAIWVAGAIGWWNTIGLLVLLSLTGLWVVKRQGLGILTTLQEGAERREVPTARLIDRFLKLVGGVLLVIPGFVTAALGLLLFLPPVRALIRGTAGKRVQATMATGRWTVSTGRWAYGTVRDVTSREVRPDGPNPQSSSSPHSPPQPGLPPEIENL
jgi:UPF0716 protein FxsA